jgi:ABC-2 type transport system permease protein
MSDSAISSYLRLYGSLGRQAIATNLQYRLNNFLYLVGMVAEPVVYLVVWSSIARRSGGSIEGYTPGAFAAYYIVWTLVRNMNITFTPFGWEERIREGSLSAHLLRPVHPVHYDIGWFAGWKVVSILLWLPVAAALTLVFHPTLDPTWQQVVTFAIAIWGAFLVRTMLLWALGLITFWTTRVNAMFEAFFACELLLSGRLVPLALMPDWAQTLAHWLPFESSFGFPITALVGPIDNAGLVEGLLRQLGWIVASSVFLAWAWRHAVRHYSAVNG